MSDELKQRLRRIRKEKKTGLKRTKKSRSKYGDNATLRRLAIQNGARKGLSTIYARDNARFQKKFTEPTFYNDDYIAWMVSVENNLNAYRRRPVPPHGFLEKGRAGAMRKPASAHRHFVERYDPRVKQVMLVPYNLRSVKPDSKRIGKRTEAQKVKVREAAVRLKKARRGEKKAEIIAAAQMLLRARRASGQAAGGEGPSAETSADRKALYRWAKRYMTNARASGTRARNKAARS